MFLAVSIPLNVTATATVYNKPGKSPDSGPGFARTDIQAYLGKAKAPSANIQLLLFGYHRAPS